MSFEQRPCQRCGEDIPRRRLEVLPHTRLCLDCSQEIGGDFKTYAVPENTGKPGSLKKKLRKLEGRQKAAEHHSQGRQIAPLAYLRSEI